MSRPFVVIAALGRTGSTVLSESLTQLPHSFILREPGLLRGRFTPKASDVELLREHGLDLEAVRERLAGHAPKRTATIFQNEVLPQLRGLMEQSGFKEIYYSEASREILSAFPSVRVVATARDPRDVYLSQYHWRMDTYSRVEFGPKRFAKNMAREFAWQRQIVSELDCLKVRYEDFCTDPLVWERVKAFVGSPIPGIGKIGGFVVTNPTRGKELELHGGRITDARVGRWRAEPDQRLVEDAHTLMELMEEYCEYWGYTP